APLVPRVRIIVPAVVVRVRGQRHVLNSGSDDEQVLVTVEDLPRLDPLVGARLAQGRNKAPLVLAAPAIVPPQKVGHLFPCEAESRARHPGFIRIRRCYAEQLDHVKPSLFCMSPHFATLWVPAPRHVEAAAVRGLGPGTNPRLRPAARRPPTGPRPVPPDPGTGAARHRSLCPARTRL